MALLSPLSSLQLQLRRRPHPPLPNLQRRHMIIAAAVKPQVPQRRGPVWEQKPTLHPEKGLAHLPALPSTW